MIEVERHAAPVSSLADGLSALVADETWAVAAYERLLARPDLEDLRVALGYCLSSHEQRRKALLEELGPPSRRHGGPSELAPSFVLLDGEAHFDTRRVLEALVASESAALERCRAVTNVAEGPVRELLSMKILPAEVQTAEIVERLLSTYCATRDSVAELE
jgi:hypothetical protein